RSAETAVDLAAAVSARLDALARAHSLTIRRSFGTTGNNDQTSLHALIQTIAAPYVAAAGSPQLTISGADLAISGSAVTSFALLLHEFATNAAKYGGFSVPEGGVDIVCEDGAEEFVLTWTERGGPLLDGPGNT